MKKRASTLLFCIIAFSGCAQQRPTTTDRQVGSSCEDCDLMFEGMPDNINWQASIAGPDEKGEPLIISGIIFKKDGKTPAPGVILYVYHTDNKGLYSPSPTQTHGKRHGHLRGWVKTDVQGRYEFKTIRPASYPNSNHAQHIHPIIKEPGVSHYWIDEFLFEDDPLLTEQWKSRSEKRGGSGVMTLTKNAAGVWTGSRNITLGLNVPDY